MLCSVGSLASGMRRIFVEVFHERGRSIAFGVSSGSLLCVGRVLTFGGRCNICFTRAHSRRVRILDGRNMNFDVVSGFIDSDRADRPELICKLLGTFLLDGGC